MRGQMFKEIERCCIQPLQVIEEQRERVLFACEHPHEIPENHLESVLRLLRRQVRDWGLFPDDELELGNEIDHELTIWTEHGMESISPRAKILLALCEEQANQTLNGLRQCGIRDVALVLVELAGREQATRRDERLVQFVH